MAMPDKLTEGQRELADFEISRLNEQLKPYGYVITRATAKPTTLDEALRDYAMFGKFVIKIGVASVHMSAFKAAWTARKFGQFPEYVAFVKKEMGK